jgi:dTDP-4-dehydrorhamnose reductase
MNILLTGASGLLGSAIMAQAQQLGMRCDPMPRPALGRDTMHQLQARFSGYDVVIHAAANTDVEKCEVEPDGCYADNFLLTELIAQAAAKAGVRTAFVSSTGIYGDWQDAPYREYDAVHPTTHHHRSKYLGEQAVLAAHGANLVVRTGWLFGGPTAKPKNFVARRIEEAQRARAGFISSNREQRGVPCYSADVAQRIIELCQANAVGVYNCVNSGNASRLEYVQAIVELAGLQVEVRPSDAASFNRKAKVSRNEMAESWKSAALGWPALPLWRDSLARYLNGELKDFGK